MQLYHTMPPATINGFPNIERNGFLAVSPVENFYTNPGPFSRLHLVDSAANANIYSQDYGWRPWMRNGITMSGNSDQMYIGQKYVYVDSLDHTSGEIDDRSDAVIEWSDNPDDTPWGTDRMRFMFTNDINVAAPQTYGAQSLEGLEAMRIYIPTDTTANVGIGDFFRAGIYAGTTQDPTERLHVKDGRVRIEQLPDDLPPDSDYVVMVVDTTATSERGVVKWVPASSIVSVADCEWSMTAGAGAGVNDVWTATGGQVDGCPDRTESVGIGTSTPSGNAKLHVYTDNFPDAVYVRHDAAVVNAVGARVEVTAGTSNNAGVVTQVSGPGTSNIGVFAVASNSTGQNTGVQAWGGGGGTSSIGLSASAGGGSNANSAITGVVNVASPRNIGDRITVNGGTVFNVGDSVTVGGGAGSNRGVVVTASGATATNIATIATVSGTATTNTGHRTTVSDGTKTNIGDSLRVSSAAGTNTGINAYTNATGPTALNYGVKVEGHTHNTTSENRGVQIDLDGAADRMRGVEVVSNCTNSGGSTNSTAYGGNFVVNGSDFRDSQGVRGLSYGATDDGQSRGVHGQALGAALQNTGVCGTYNTTQPLDHEGGYGVYGHNRPGESGYDIGTAGYVESEGVIFPPIKGRTGVAGVVRPAQDIPNIGTLGYVGTGAPASLSAKIGVYGEARDWAGWFMGDTWTQGIGFFTAGMFTISDQSLKENVVEPAADEVASVLSQLHPVSYDFTPEARESLALPEGQQFGLLAQEVEQVLPGLVKETTHPALRDSMGNTLQEAMSLKTVNYPGLIPYLIADNQRLQARLDQLQEQIASCCAAGTGTRAMQGPNGAGAASETDLRIVPNPVADRTELRYTVANAGRVRLEVTDQMGRVVLTKDEGTREAAAYMYQWDTTMLAAGTYFCTLYVNDEPLVKKAVKLNAR